MENLVARGSIPALNKTDLEQFPIPVPPIEVQQEIVRVLDLFTAHAAELQARKEQYEYYRNLLLSFNRADSAADGQQKDSNVNTPPHRGLAIQWKPMGEIAYIPKEKVNIKRLPNSLYIGVENLLKDKAGMIPAIKMPSVHDVIEFRTNDILIGNIRPYLKKIWIADKAGGTNGDVVLIRINDNGHILPKFLFHVLASDNFFFYHDQYAKGAKMPRGDKNAVMKYLIPIPPIELQEKIVAILDRFETLVNDLTTGLPAEIAAVKELYEYYRNKLLTFKPIGVAALTL